MPSLLSAADFGIVNIPPTPSQKFRSPIKVGEYLCCGLPFLICKGVSEDALYVSEEKVGVVVNDFTKESIQQVLPEIKSLLSEPTELLKKRCSKIGVKYRGVSVFKNVFNTALQALTSS